MWFISKNFDYFKHSLFPTTSLVPYKFEITEINCSVLKKGKSAAAISSLFNGSESSVSSVSFENSILDKSSILFRIYLNQRNIFLFFFFYQGFLHRHWQFTGQQGKGGDHRLFHSTTSTCSPTLRHLYATLHVRWLSRIFNRNGCVYQTATRWDLPLYRITIWVIDWWYNGCLFTWWIDTRILLQRFDIGNRWIWTRIDIPITREPTNQVCCCSKIFGTAEVIMVHGLLFSHSSPDRIPVKHLEIFFTPELLSWPLHTICFRIFLFQIIGISLCVSCV